MLRLKRHDCKCNAQLLHEFSVRISTEPYVLDSNMDWSFWYLSVLLDFVKSVLKDHKSTQMAPIWT